jgi:16S rRNA C1402 N4-methylase RsmH
MKTVYPSKEEVDKNKASRSGKLRTLIKKHE